jgi:hypothetical protein
MAAKWLKKVGEHLKGIAPMLVGAAGTALGGPAAGGVLATIMREVTGKGEGVDLDSIADEIFGSPELRYKLEELAVQRERMMHEARYRELQIEEQMQKNVNETMRAEATAEDPWTRRWRPYFGFVAGTAFGIQVLGVVYVMVTGGDPDLIAQVAGLTVIWAPAMAVLGINGWTRGKEKTARIENGNGNG